MTGVLQIASRVQVCAIYLEMYQKVRWSDKWIKDQQLDIS